MFKRSIPSPAMVIACIALFVALGGTGYAATHFASEGATASKKGKAKRGPRGPRGHRGPIGPTGPAGPVGAPGKDAFGALVYKKAEASNPNNSQDFVEAACNPGEHVTGGGIFSSSGALGQDINSSYPSDGSGTGEFGNTAWAGYVDNETGSTRTITAFAICAKVGSVTGP
jgi:hypothetical protein